MTPESVAGEATARRPGPVWYVVAVMSTMPLMGVLFGLAAVIGGLAMLRSGGRLILILGGLGLGGQTLVLSFVLHAAFK